MRDRERPSRRLLLRAGAAAAALGAAGRAGAGPAATPDASSMDAEKPAATSPAAETPAAKTPGGRYRDSLDTDYFKGMYAHEGDPWHFATSAYERAKYAATLAALPRDHYASALDVGCSIGVFTHALCRRCDAVLGLDVVPSVLEAARARCADCPDARFMLAAVPGTWPDGRFDLIVISEVAYYLDHADLARLVSRVEGAVLPGADIVLVHWLGVTHYPLSGDEAAEGFIAGARGFARVLTQSRTAQYRLDVLRATAAPPAR